MKELFISMRRNPYQSLASFFVLFVNLFLSIIILFSLSFLYGLLGYVETRPQVTVYFKTQTAEADIFKIREQLVASGKVLDVNYVSKEKAFKIYKDLNKDNPLLLEMVTSDILPPSLEIYAKKPTFLPEIAEFLKKQPGVDEVNFQKVIIDRLLTLTDIIRKISMIFFLLLVGTTIIILTTVTLFKVALKKDEIELLRLLGASRLYVKKPFLNEAFIFGLISATCAFAFFALIILYFNPFLGSYLRGISNLSINLDFYQIPIWPLSVQTLGIIFGFTAFFGIGISTIAALLATNKYIK